MLSLVQWHPDVHVLRDYLVPAINPSCAVDPSSPNPLKCRWDIVFFFRLFLKNKMCLYTPEEDKKDVGSPRAGVTGCCELPDMGAGFQMWVLWKIKKGLCSLSHVYRPWDQGSNIPAISVLHCTAQV